MDNILHIYLTKLLIISKIPINGKIDITHNDLNIYDSSILNWFNRKLYGDSKYNATKYLTDLYREINLFSDQLIYSIISDTDDISKKKKMNMLVKLAEKIKKSLVGIKNLTGTYKGYIKVVSLLECLEQDIIIPQYNAIINFIPKDKQTDVIKSEMLAYSPSITKTTDLSPNINITKPSNPINIKKNKE